VKGLSKTMPPDKANNQQQLTLVRRGALSTALAQLGARLGAASRGMLRHTILTKPVS